MGHHMSHPVTDTCRRMTTVAAHTDMLHSCHEGMLLDPFHVECQKVHKNQPERFRALFAL